MTNPVVTSVGFKRRLAAFIAMAAQLAAAFPVLAPVLPLLNWAAGLLGTAGVLHSVPANTTTKYLSGTLTSVLVALLVAAQYLPALEAYVPFINKLILILGTLTVTQVFDK